MGFPLEFKKCPVCGSTETVTQLAYKEANNLLPSGFVSAGKITILLQDPTQLTVTQGKGLLIHLDYCAGCGSQRCTKAEILPSTVHVNINKPPPPPGTKR